MDKFSHAFSYLKKNVPNIGMDQFFLINAVMLLKHFKHDFRCHLAWITIRLISTLGKSALEPLVSYCACTTRKTNDTSLYPPVFCVKLL